MLHIILVILKALGILLAAILLLFLLALLLLLFVPLRYEVAFRHTEEETFVKGKVSWLLHLVRGVLSYEKPEGKQLQVKIGGFQLFPPKERKKKVPKARRKKTAASAPQKEKAEKPRIAQKAPLSEMPPQKQTIQKEQGVSVLSKTETAPTKTVSEEPAAKTELVASEEIPVKKEPEQKEEILGETRESAAGDFTENLKKSEDAISRGMSHKEEAGQEQKTSILEKIQEKFREIPEFFKKLRAIFLAIGQLVKRQIEKIKGIFHSLSELKAKITHYLEIWKEEETQALIRTVKGYLFYLLRHIRPRRGKGYLKYGLPDPALTGQLTGILYLLRPLTFSSLALEPVFETEELVLEGDLVIRGHIRIVHLVSIGLRLLFDKNLKHFRQRLKE